jgi:hypothetical protein
VKSMALPQTVRVKLSSEAAGAITLTPVVMQELALGELIEHVLGLAGKDEARIREILLRGTLVTGASRFRWEGFRADAEDLREALAAFPDPDPGRAFDVARCMHAILRGGRAAIEIPREAGERKGIFTRVSFWDALMEVAGAGAAYAGYSYRTRADRYTHDFSVAETERLRAAADSVRYNTLRDQIRTAAFTSAELLAVRK